MDILKEQVKKISSLEIQGATNVAKFGVTLLKEYAQRHKDLPNGDLWNNLLTARDLIYHSRATEPAMRNGLYFIMNKIDNHRTKDKTKVDIAAKAGIYADEYLKILNDSKTQITKIGANRIPNKDRLTIMTHCHSSVVTGILLEAAKQGKKFTVICTETRPAFQGRITAKELIDAKIPTKQVVDSAMRWAVRTFDVDMILIGADAITSEGTVINKIGSRLLALVAREMHIPYYVATPLLKFNPDTSFGALEKIEIRESDEIWPDRPKGLEVLNPAFETVSRRYIDSLITEAGIFPATLVSHMFNEKYPYLRPEYTMPQQTTD
jgi:ribose 1,5-bisphosphate isomerase